MQNIFIVWKASSVYLAGAKAMTRVFGTGISKGPALLNVGILWTKFSNSSE